MPILGGRGARRALGRGPDPSRCAQGGASCSWLPSRQEGKEEGSRGLKNLCSPLPHLVWLI